MDRKLSRGTAFMFEDAIRRHEAERERVSKIAPPPSWKLLVRRISLIQRQRRWEQRHPGQVRKPDPALWRLFQSGYIAPKRPKPENLLDINGEFMMENGDNVLTSTGSTLDNLAATYNVPEDLPVKEKQEAVYTKMVETHLDADEEWTRQNVIQQKQHFLKTLEKTHFFGITCKTIGLKESLVRGWIRTDPSFAESVREVQTRTAEMIGHAMIRKALVDEDLGAQMYLMKKFESTVQFVEPDAVVHSQTADGLDISKLSPAEQETLLALMRKSQANESAYTATTFQEDEVEAIAPDIEATVRKFIEEEVPAPVMLTPTEAEGATDTPPTLPYEGD